MEGRIKKNNKERRDEFKKNDEGNEEEIKRL